MAVVSVPWRVMPGVVVMMRRRRVPVSRGVVPRVVVMMRRRRVPVSRGVVPRVVMVVRRWRVPVPRRVMPRVVMVVRRWRVPVPRRVMPGVMAVRGRPVVGVMPRRAGLDGCSGDGNATHAARTCRAGPAARVAAAAARAGCRRNHLDRKAIRSRRPPFLRRHRPHSPSHPATIQSRHARRPQRWCRPRVRSASRRWPGRPAASGSALPLRPRIAGSAAAARRSPGSSRRRPNPGTRARCHRRPRSVRRQRGRHSSRAPRGRGRQMPPCRATA